MSLLLWAVLSLPEAGREDCFAVSPPLNEHFCLESPHKDMVKTKRHLDNSCMGQLDEPAHSTPHAPVFARSLVKKFLGSLVIHLLLSSQFLLNLPPLCLCMSSFEFMRQRTWKSPAQSCFAGY